MLLLVASLPFLFLFLKTIQATCYFPDGAVSSTDVPCDASASVSFCCFSGQACLSNKLCYDPATLRYARGTCTDPNWESAACPKFCLDTVGLGNPVFSCNTSSSDSYCCNDGCSCDTGAPSSELVSFTGTPYTETIIGSPQTFATPSPTSASSSSSSSSTSTSTSTSAYTSLSTTTASTAVAAGATNGPSTSSGSNSNARAIGIDIGVAGDVIVLVLAALAVLRWRKRSGANRVPTSPAVAVGHEYGASERKDYNPLRGELSGGRDEQKWQVRQLAQEMGTDPHGGFVELSAAGRNT